jgi:hypothetical protein
MKKLIVNAFSAGMLPVGRKVNVEFAPVEPGGLELADYESAVGHADTAFLFASALGIPVACNRATVALAEGDVALLGQYSGPRLPEGCKTLPDGASIRWMLVRVLEVTG